MVYNEKFLNQLEQGLINVLVDWQLDINKMKVKLLTISENATFLVQHHNQNERYIFRVQRPNYHIYGEQEVLSELAWVDALQRDHIVDTARPIATKSQQLVNHMNIDGNLFNIVAFEFKQGKEPESTDDLTKWYKILGKTSAQMHSHSRQWRKPQCFIRKTWDFSTTIGANNYWGDWRHSLGLSADGQSLLEKVTQQLKQRTDAYGKDDKNFGLIHCDMRLANLLVYGDKLTIIDFDDCGLSWYLYDLAASLSFIEHEPYVPQLIQAWLEGYQQECALSQVDLSMITTLIMLRRIQMMAWVSSHYETPTGQKMGVNFTQQTLRLAENYLNNKAWI